MFAKIPKHKVISAMNYFEKQRERPKGKGLKFATDEELRILANSSGKKFTAIFRKIGKKHGVTGNYEINKANGQIVKDNY